MEAAVLPDAVERKAEMSAAPAGPPLKDLLEDGVHLLFLLKNGHAPDGAEAFNQQVDTLLAGFERHAAGFGKPLEAIQDSKYAFCAVLDEIILSSDFGVREAWERNPLQLRLFGEHLAGEGFFDRLERLRLEPLKYIETIEVFHTCLILGFQGKYLLEGEARLGLYTARIGQEIASVRGGRAGFAPHWKPPFQFQAFVRHELPVWVFHVLLVLVAFLLFLAFTCLLRGQVRMLAGPPSPPGCAAWT